MWAALSSFAIWVIELFFKKKGASDVALNEAKEMAKPAGSIDDVINRL